MGLLLRLKLKGQLEVHRFFVIIALMVLLSSIAYAVRLPSLGEDDSSLQEYLNRTLEQEINGKRIKTTPVDQRIQERKASEDKAPFTSDNLWDMELPAWPHFNISAPNLGSNPKYNYIPNPYNYIPNPQARGYIPQDERKVQPGWYVIGCVLFCPGFPDCDEPFT
jgi:hypothetical protein